MLTVRPFGGDIHLHPLYLKWAAHCLREGNRSEGLSFFKAACGNLSVLEGKVYEQLWKLVGCPGENSKYGRAAFYSDEGLSSTLLEKAQAIERVISKEDWDELRLRETQIYERFFRIHGRSGVEDTLLAAREYADESRVLTWHLNGGKASLITRDGSTDRLWSGKGIEVRLIKRADGRFEYWKNDSSGLIVMELMDTGDASSEDVIKAFLQCDVTVNREHVDFIKITPCAYWPEPIVLPENKELSLVQKGDDVTWRLFDKTAKKVSWTYASLNVIYLIKTWCEGWYPSETPWFKDYKIEISLDNLGGLSNVWISKIHAKSRLDSTKIIDRDNWAITLVTVVGGEREREDLQEAAIRFAGHAMIAYEGIEGGEPFLRYAHLHAGPITCKGTGFAKVEIVRGTQHLIDITTSKSETWIRSRAAIKVMETKIKEEEKVGRNIPFDLSMGGYCRTTPAQHVTEFFTGVQSHIEAYAASCLSWSTRHIDSTGIILPFVPGLGNNHGIPPRAYVAHITAFPGRVEPGNILEGINLELFSNEIFSTAYRQLVSSFRSEIGYI